MRTTFVISLSFLLVGLVATTDCLAQLTDAERSCQLATGKEIGKYGKTLTKCSAKCQKTTPQSADCAYPYGPGTAAETCRNDAWSKATNAIQKRCSTGVDDSDSCPECFETHDFGGGIVSTCAAFDSGMQDLIGQVNEIIVDPLLWCDDSGSDGGLNPDEAKCRGKTAAALGTYVSKMTTCLKGCGVRESKGTALGSCSASEVGFPTADPTLNTCIEDAADAFAAKATKVCQDWPECWGQTPETLAGFLAWGSVLITADPITNCNN